MLTHLYQGYNGEPHLSFAVHLTQVIHTSQLAEKCGVLGCFSQLCCLPGKSRAALKPPTAATSLKVDCADNVLESLGAVSSRSWCNHFHEAVTRRICVP